MRVVLDTNILARAFSRPLGPAGALLKLLRDSSEHILILSEGMIEELHQTLCYGRLRRIHDRLDEEIEAFLALLHLEAEMVDPIIIAVVPNDPDDDLVVATAVDGEAEFLVSLDRHLRLPWVTSYLAQRGVRLLTDVEFLRELRST